MPLPGRAATMGRNCRVRMRVEGRLSAVMQHPRESCRPAPPPQAGFQGKRPDKPCGSGAIG